MSNIQEEIWKDLIGYEGIYRISSGGVIEYRCHKSGKIKIRKSQIDKSNGYVYIRLFNPAKTHKVHRLVASTFIPNPDSKPQVNHKNGIKTDNNVVNLEWVTSKENVNYSKETFGTFRGEKHSKAILSELSELSVLDIRRKYQQGVRKIELTKQYKISYGHVEAILNKRIWKHI